MAAAMFAGEHRRGELAPFMSAPNSAGYFTPPSASQPDPPETLSHGTPDEVIEASRRARAAQHAWAAMPTYFRLSALRRLPMLLDLHCSLVASVLRGDGALSTQEAQRRVADLAQACQRLTRTGLRALRPVKHRRRLRVRAVEHHEPYGLIGIASNRAIDFDPVTTVAALLAGNAVLLVPQGAAGHAATVLAQLCNACLLPKDLVQVVPDLTGLAEVAIEQLDHLVVPSDGEGDQPLEQLAGSRGIQTTAGSADPATFTTLAVRT